MSSSSCFFSLSFASALLWYGMRFSFVHRKIDASCFRWCETYGSNGNRNKIDLIVCGNNSVMLCSLHVFFYLGVSNKNVVCMRYVDRSRKIKWEEHHHSHTSTCVGYGADSECGEKAKAKKKKGISIINSIEWCSSFLFPSLTPLAHQLYVVLVFI